MAVSTVPRLSFVGFFQIFAKWPRPYTSWGSFSEDKQYQHLPSSRVCLSTSLVKCKILFSPSSRLHLAWIAGQRAFIPWRLSGFPAFQLLFKYHSMKFLRVMQTQEDGKSALRNRTRNVAELLSSQWIFPSQIAASPHTQAVLFLTSNTLVLDTGPHTILIAHGAWV